jgi:uncharacterized protein involved in type VI secretion and phage assembly
VQGVEGVSVPFYFDVTMLRRFDSGDINPVGMINTPVTFGMRGETGTYTYRSGIFQTFRESGTTDQRFEVEGGFHNGEFRLFKGRIVPLFQLLDDEIRYRVFENMTVSQIIDEVLAGFAPYIAPNYLTKHFDDSPPITYCVQFGETSFNFLSRLMMEFGICYRFRHDHGGASTINRMTLGTDRMVMFDPKTFSAALCSQPAMSVVPVVPSETEIAGFEQVFMPARKRAWVGDFNMINPKQTPRGSAWVGRSYNMIDPPQIRNPYTAGPFEREVFPAYLSDPENSDDKMAGQAKDRIEDEENNVFTVTGQCRNTTFVAGHTFLLMQKARGVMAVGVPATDTYLVTQISISAFENAYGRNIGQDLVNWLDSPIRWLVSLFRTDALKQGAFFDPMSVLASNGLNNWSQAPGKLGNTVKASELSAIGPTLVQALAQVWISSATQEMTLRHAGRYANAFTAIPFDGGTYKLVPNPDAPKPRANGPHLAVVVGTEGTKNVASGGSTDRYHEGLGRVRIRFPWQREVHGDPPSDPLKSDRSTCWVSVSEGWAGGGFGTQFMPRIGQEVIVSFLDGDPERPIITGRRYNAEGGKPNLPFKANTETYTIQDWNKPASTTGFRFDGIKTASTPQGGNPSRYHLLRFDDTYNCEQVLLRSQGRLDVTAKSNSFETTFGNKNVTVVPGNDATGKQFGGSMLTTIGGDTDIHVGGSRHEQVDKDHELTVKGDMRLDLQQNLAAVIKGDVSIGLNSLTIEATEKITLKVGASFIVIDHCAVYIHGPSMIYENSGGSPDSAVAVTLKNVADAALAEPGDVPDKRLTPCSLHVGHAGPPATHTQSPTPAPICTSVVNGVACNFLPSAQTDSAGSLS